MEPGEGIPRLWITQVGAIGRGYLRRIERMYAEAKGAIPLCSSSRGAGSVFDFEPFGPLDPNARITIS
jgi:hypothetical protein